MIRCFNNLTDFMIKYPFSKEGLNRFRRITETEGLYVNDLPNMEEGRKLLKRAHEILKEALINHTIRDNWDLGDYEVVAHYVAIILASHLDKSLWRRFADVESKRFSARLGSEDLECVLYIAREFDIRIARVRDLDLGERFTEAFDIGVRVWDYLRFMPKNDPNWKLVNRYLVNGWVLMDIKDLVRLVEEAVEGMVMNLIERASEDKEATEKLVEALGGLNDLMKLSIKPRIKIQPRGGLPPCMEAIINEIRSGGNPSHQARFALASFMLRKCHDVEGRPVEECVEDVVNLFRTVADFDEKVTRYQVEHIAGLRGGRKFYMPPSCEEMNSLGLCPTNMGCGVKNPLQYASRAVARQAAGN
ncbi:DNA primase [Vulcanisaeta thermophila]|uniref:DNA primase n=1 Tax=Vulcanisaeta thermophila TaxID=867917 RepID=UPI000853DD2C|nr:DNA primase [Vulcanisaeta thermophila]